MAKLVVLMGGILKQCDVEIEHPRKIYNPKFNYASGIVMRFILNKESYIHVKFSDFKEGDRNSPKIASAGYYLEREFLKYRSGVHKAGQLAKFKLDPKLIDDGIVRDTIWLRKIKILHPYVDFCQVHDLYWEYAGGKIIGDDLNIIMPPSKDITEDAARIVVDPVADGFYNRNIEWVRSNNFPSNQRDRGAYLISMIALEIERVMKDVFPILQGDETLDLYIASQKSEWQFADIFNDPNLNDLTVYLQNIIGFYQSVFINKQFIKEAKTKTKLYWLAHVLSENALRVIPAENKIDILKVIAQGAILGEMSMVVPTTINEEEFAIKVVRSVSPGQEDSFLFGLQLVEILGGLAEKETLFAALYNKINNVGGVDNLKTMMEVLYLIWLRSSFYPLNFDGTAKNDLISPAVYGTNPIVIDYESSTILNLFDSTNYDFWFNGSKIDVMRPITQGSRNYHEKVGSYGCYQAITIKSIDLNSNDTRFIAVRTNGVSHYVMPIFYLKYIDDNKETTNLENSLKLAVDLALLFAGGGIGNLRHLMHLKNLNKLGRAMLKLDVMTPELVLMRYELAQGLALAVEITGETAKILNEYVSKYQDFYCKAGPNYDSKKCDFHTKLSNTFTALQLVGEVLDPVFSKNLRKTAKDLLSGNLPEDFPDKVFDLLTEFAGNTDDIMEAFRKKLDTLLGSDSHIWQKIDKAGQPGELSITERDELIVDFERASDEDLKKLNANGGSLLNYWRTVRSQVFLFHRKNITYLECLRDIKSNRDLYEEIFIGVFKSEVNPHDPNTPSWNAKGIHHKNALDVTKGGIGKIRGSEMPIMLGYYNALVEMYNPEYPKTNQDGERGWKKKNSNKGVSTFFRKDWEVQKVQEELAMAFMKRKRGFSQGNADAYRGIMSDGVETLMYIENGHITTMHPSFKTI